VNFVWVSEGLARWTEIQIGDKLSVLKWLHSWDKAFCATGIMNLLGLWKMCICVKGEYLENE
jgi:hypothetical protein